MGRIARVEECMEQRVFDLKVRTGLYKVGVPKDGIKCGRPWQRVEQVAVHCGQPVGHTVPPRVGASVLHCTLVDVQRIDATTAAQCCPHGRDTDTRSHLQECSPDRIGKPCGEQAGRWRMYGREHTWKGDPFPVQHGKGIYLISGLLVPAE